MNQSIVKSARKGLKAKGFFTRRGLCQGWVRQVVADAMGSEWENIVRAPSAKEAAFKLLKSGHAHHYNGKPSSLEPGDLLYKTEGSGGFGHTGVYLGDNEVAENSSYHARHDSDARGIRTLAQFGAFQVVARLPDPKAKDADLIVPKPAPAVAPAHAITADPQLVLNGKLVCQVIKIGGAIWAPVRPILEASGKTLTGVNDSIAEKQRFYINTK